MAAILEESGSMRKLKALIKDYWKREALALIDPETKLNLLQMSVVMGNIAAGMHRPCSPLFVRIDLLDGMHCLTCLIVHGAAECLIALGADVDAWWDHDRPDMAPRGLLSAQLPLMRGKRLFWKCYGLFKRCRAADTWANARLSLLHLAASASASQALQNTPVS